MFLEDEKLKVRVEMFREGRENKENIMFWDLKCIYGNYNLFMYKFIDWYID